MKHDVLSEAVKVVLLVVLSLTFSGLIYFAIPFQAEPRALQALQSDSEVRVERSDYGWFFDGPSEEDALIFYPGARVDTAAYSVLARAIAHRGLDVFLADMPLHLALLNENAADRIISRYRYANWMIGGHSLGGAVSAEYAAKHAGSLSGIVLLGAYSLSDLPDTMKTIVIRGSEDHVLNSERYRKNLVHLSSRTVEYVIPGGNHSQFGCYGLQPGDGAPRISADRQQEETARMIAEVLLSDGTEHNP